MGRDRAMGWKHAKLSGHKNEDAVKRLFDDKEFCKRFAQRLEIAEIKTVHIGGLNEKDVPCVLGGKTKSKTDLVMTLCDNLRVNISIKKSAAGQVYLITVDRFIEGFEKQYAVSIPEDIKDSLRLYFYGHEDISLLLNTPEVIRGESSQLILYQKRKGRLVWDSLKNYDAEKADRFKLWLQDNIANIVDFCFSRGLAQNSEDWADYVWYVNELGEGDFDDLFKIEDVKEKVRQNVAAICPSNRNGGSTIWLPFGFVQWHQAQMQFHHKLALLRVLF